MASGAVAGATIAAPVALSSSLTVTNNSSQILTISGSIDTAGNALVVTGIGPVVITGVISNSSGAGTVTKSGSGKLSHSGSHHLYWWHHRQRGDRQCKQRQRPGNHRHRHARRLQ
jgi:hypothetical protein